MELAILDFIYTYLNYDILDPFFKIITYSGNDGFIFIIIALILSINKKTRRIGLYCFAALIIGALITNVFLKPFIARIRPYEYKDIVLKIAKPTDYSFPSGHTTAGFAVAFVLIKEKFTYWGKKLYVYLLIFAILMAYSRLYFYVHFPSDILMGVFVGYLASKGAGVVIDKLYKRAV